MIAHIIVSVGDLAKKSVRNLNPKLKTFLKQLPALKLSAMVIEKSSRTSARMFMGSDGKLARNIEDSSIRLMRKDRKLVQVKEGAKP